MLENNSIYIGIQKIETKTGGEAYKAYHTQLQKYVILKPIEDEKQKNLRNEINYMRNLHHQYLTQIVDYVEEDGKAYLVAEYVQGQSLEQIIRSNERVDTDTCIKWVKQFCMVLTYLYQQKPLMIYGDINPSRVLVKKDGDICLAGYRITSLTESDQKENQKQIAINHRADIYSLGKILEDLLLAGTGLKRDSRRKSLMEVARKASQLEPENRYQSIQELLSDVNDIQNKKHTVKRKEKKAHGKKFYIIFGMILTVFVVAYGVFVVVATRDCGEKYTQAYKLYKKAEYKKTIRYVHKNMIERKIFWINSDRAGEMYYMIGISYLQEKKYTQACDYLKKAVQKDKKSDYYRDYASALIRCGRTSEAKTQLEEAKGKIVSGSDLIFTEAELNEMEGNYTEAIADYKESLKNNVDDEMNMRAYLSIAECMEKNDYQIPYEEEIDILKEGKEAVSEDYRGPILEKLAQSYINYADETKSDAYQLDAISILQEIIELSKDQLSTHDNLVVLYMETDQIDLAKEELTIMKEKYGDCYEIYKRYAFLELKVQEKLDQDHRNYEQFSKYYKQAQNLFQNIPQRDIEMFNLDEAYGQLIREGWLAESK